MMRFRTLSILAFGLFFLLSCKEPAPVAPDATSSSSKNLKYLALGDSYTIGERVSMENRWPNQLAEKLKEESVFVDSVKIIARTGWRTDQLQTAIAQEPLTRDWDLVSLLIGVNNQYQGRSIEVYEAEFEELLLEAISLAGGDTSRVFVVSIPDYGYTPFGQSNQASISAELDAFNEVNERISAQYHVTWYNITPISREGLNRSDYVAPDGLHPSGVQYAAWVESFYQQVAEGVRD